MTDFPSPLAYLEKYGVDETGTVWCKQCFRWRTDQTRDVTWTTVTTLKEAVEFALTHDGSNHSEPPPQPQPVKRGRPKKQ
jgi:hypothetical protein